MKRLLSLVAGAALVLALPVQAAAETMDASMAPSGMALVGDTLYVADVCHRAVWTVEDGEAVLLTGRTEVTDLSGQPVAGYNDGPFAQAAFSEPWAIVPYDGGFLVSAPLPVLVGRTSAMAQGSRPPLTPPRAWR